MDNQTRKFTLKHFIIIIIILIIILGITISISQFTFKREYKPPTALSDILPRFRMVDLDKAGITGDEDGDGTINQKEILSGAKKQLEAPAKNIFSEGLNEPNYYKDGDPPPEFALCTDIIARAFKQAGLDIRSLVNEDITNNFDQYPLRQIWGQRTPDSNIDYRRIQNLEVFFKRNSQVLLINFDPANYDNLNSWLPGDIVFFDMDKDGYSDNVGILSDKTTRKGVLKVIYNYIEPGYTIEKDILEISTITGHFRWGTL